MKTHRNYLGVNFESREIDLMKLRISDLFYIAFVALNKDSAVPSNIEIANLLYNNNFRSVNILRDPENKFQFIAKLK